MGARGEHACAFISHHFTKEVSMSGTQMSKEQVGLVPKPATVDLKLEVVILPVADAERSKSFYQGLGWRLDADFSNPEGWHAIQMTPPGSPCSIIFGKGVTTAAPGSVQGTFLIVENVDAARAELKAKGVDVSDVFHFEGPRALHVDGTEGRVKGRHPENRSYSSWASFSDPDGNTWMLQEITTRLPGRGFGGDVPAMTSLLKEAEQHHGQYEASAPKHHWSDWYSAYIVARQNGSTPDAASEAAGRHMSTLSA
jgi:catechol 2,3-dioxygenase-like lactoylglutathione lyase family enzyme